MVTTDLGRYSVFDKSPGIFLCGTEIQSNCLAMQPPSAKENLRSAYHTKTHSGVAAGILAQQGDACILTARASQPWTHTICVQWHSVSKLHYRAIPTLLDS